MLFSTGRPTPQNFLFCSPSYTLSHWAAELHVQARPTHKYSIITDRPTPENFSVLLLVLHKNIAFFSDRPAPEKMGFILTVLHPKSEFGDDGPFRPLHRWTARAGTSYTRKHLIVLHPQNRIFHQQS